MLKKIGYIADYEGRSVNSHVLVLIRNDIRKFEEQNGSINGIINPDVNVKPTRKNKHLYFIKRVNHSLQE